MTYVDIATLISYLWVSLLNVFFCFNITFYLQLSLPPNYWLLSLLIVWQYHLYLLSRQHVKVFCHTKWYENHCVNEDMIKIIKWDYTICHKLLSCHNYIVLFPGLFRNTWSIHIFPSGCRRCFIRHCWIH